MSSFFSVGLHSDYAAFHVVLHHLLGAAALGKDGRRGNDDRSGEGAGESGDGQGLVESVSWGNLLLDGSCFGSVLDDHDGAVAERLSR